jgi:inorganic pyrophosphatase
MNLPSAFSHKKKHLHAVIETPKYSSYKYKYDPELKLFKLGKMLPAGCTFPLDMGFIPGTKGEDGDPLDILILMEHPTFQGCLIECRLLGVLEATQKEKGKKETRNDRYIAVPADSIEYTKIKHLRQLEKYKLQDLIAFFEFYNKAEHKTFRVSAVHGPEKATEMIRKNIQS